MIDLIIEVSSKTHSSVPREIGIFNLTCPFVISTNSFFISLKGCCEVVKLSIFDDSVYRCQGARTGLYLKTGTYSYGKPNFIHGEGESAIWYYYKHDHFWAVGNVEDRGTTYVGLYSETVEDCPEYIYYKNWMFTCGSEFKPARSVLIQCSSMEGDSVPQKMY